MLSRLRAINRQRHSYEQLFGGVSGSVGSPRSVAVAVPPVSDYLVSRARSLLHARQAALDADLEKTPSPPWRAEDHVSERAAEEERRRERARELADAMREKSEKNAVARRGSLPIYSNSGSGRVRSTTASPDL